jgi:hypothetical protein
MTGCTFDGMPQDQTRESLEAVPSGSSSFSPCSWWSPRFRDLFRPQAVLYYLRERAHVPAVPLEKMSMNCLTSASTSSSEPASWLRWARRIARNRRLMFSIM